MQLDNLTIIVRNARTIVPSTITRQIPLHGGVTICGKRPLLGFKYWLGALDLFEKVQLRFHDEYGYDEIVARITRRGLHVVPADTRSQPRQQIDQQEFTPTQSSLSSSTVHGSQFATSQIQEQAAFLSSQPFSQQPEMACRPDNCHSQVAPHVGGSRLPLIPTLRRPVVKRKRSAFPNADAFTNTLNSKRLSSVLKVEDSSTAAASDQAKESSSTQLPTERRRSSRKASMPEPGAKQTSNRPRRRLLDPELDPDSATDPGAQASPLSSQAAPAGTASSARRRSTARRQISTPIPSTRPAINDISERAAVQNIDTELERRLVSFLRDPRCVDLVRSAERVLRQAGIGITFDEQVRRGC